MPSLSRRTLLKGSALIGAYGLGLAAANRFAEAAWPQRRWKSRRRPPPPFWMAQYDEDVFTYSLPVSPPRCRRCCA